MLELGKIGERLSAALGLLCLVGCLVLLSPGVTAVRADESAALHARAAAIHDRTDGFENPFVLFAESSYAALIDEREEALRFLRRAVDHGFADVDKLLSHPDFEALREDPGFEEIVTMLRRSGTN